MLDWIGEHPVAAVIVACEVGLWVLLALGLTLRYVAGARRASTVALAGIPLLDVVLVAAAYADLRGGADADATHGLAAVYLGFSVAVGPSIVRWADARAAHRLAGGPAPARIPKHGPRRLAHLWREWLRVVAAATIASLVLLGLIATAAGPGDDAVLAGWIGRAWIVVGFWLLFGPLWEVGRRDDGRAAARPSS